MPFAAKTARTVGVGWRPSAGVGLPDVVGLIIPPPSARESLRACEEERAGAGWREETGDCGNQGWAMEHLRGRSALQVLCSATPAPDRLTSGTKQAASGESCGYAHREVAGNGVKPTLITA